MKIRFGTKTIFILIGVVALFFASWRWTDTIGVQHLERKYTSDAHECIRSGSEKDGINLGQTVEEYFASSDTDHYFENPRAIFPFLISVDTDGSFDAHWALQSARGSKRTHLWFFGYVSDPL